MINLTGVIKIVGDHDADDDAGRQSLTPICESLAIQFGIIWERANRGQPALVTLRQPDEKLIVRT